MKVQLSYEGGVVDAQQSESEDESHMLFHSVHNPIFQEVREAIILVENFDNKIIEIEIKLINSNYKISL